MNDVNDFCKIQNDILQKYLKKMNMDMDTDMETDTILVKLKKKLDNIKYESYDELKSELIEFQIYIIRELIKKDNNSYSNELLFK
jgi:hypothetical protein